MIFIPKSNARPTSDEHAETSVCSACIAFLHLCFTLFLATSATRPAMRTEAINRGDLSTGNRAANILPSNQHTPGASA
jgi:hypothetical protein